MFRHCIRIVSVAALVACSHAQEIKPTPAPAAKVTAPVPTPIASETRSPAAIATPSELVPSLDAIHFDFDKAIIHAEDAAALEGIAAYLQRSVDRVLTIAGHCDERGTVEYNIALGDRRATAARDYLVRLGIDSTRIKTISYGEARPADQGHDEQAWAKNRRDEFQVEQKQRAAK